MKAGDYVKLKSGDMVRICYSAYFDVPRMILFTGVALKTNGSVEKVFRFKSEAIRRKLTVAETVVMKLKGV